MARLPALATSLAVHAVAFAVVVLVPIFGNEPLPETTPPTMPIEYWPVRPPVVLADSRLPAPARRTSPARASSGGATLPAQPPSTPPVAAVIDPTGDPVDSATELADSESPTDGLAHSGECCGIGTGTDPTSTGPGGGGGGPIHVGGRIRQPTKLRHVNPEYPELARRAGMGGEVVLECLIDVRGEVTDVRVLSGNPLLREAAVDAVRRWQYTPTELNGSRVPVLLTVTIRFILGR